MTTLALDTLKAAKKLRDAGFGEAQAEALVTVVSSALDDTVATKADIKEVRVDINALKAKFEADLKSLEQRMTIKLGGMLVVGIGVIFTIDRLLG